MKILDKNTDLALLILRLSVGILLLLHGISKIVYGGGFIEQLVLAQGLPAFLSYGVYIGEVLAPLLLIAGVATRAAAGVIIVNFVVAVLMVHTGDILSLGAEGGWKLELIGLYTFGALALLVAGGGKYALSHKQIWD